jgi:hypothetical protein
MKHRPEPTRGTRYDTYLVPRSKTPAKTALYEFLLSLDWRFDSSTGIWHTPEARTLQGLGRLEYGPDLDWAAIQPPSVGQYRPAPLLSLSRDKYGWKVI